MILFDASSATRRIADIYFHVLVRWYIPLYYDNEIFSNNVRRNREWKLKR